MNFRTCPLRHRAGKVPEHASTWSWRSDIVEICLAALCSAVIWRYTSHNDHESGHKGNRLGSPGERNGQDVIVYPSDGLMLWSCLVYGCCVSSFIHRRQEQDPFQLFVYLIFVTGAGVAGYAAGASANMMLLGYLPQSMCIAMAASLSGHGLYRRWKCVAPSPGDEEKLQPIR
ncbi:hypothetical protein QBC32DRAFT_126081 [Pseudoneurospora amorphoporcata]|uniref:Uncharacterized protein n=1 Tax=Pseudoneurospora amorphoporcata TaxID=241081 RepID=A0AAN6NW39_9PEZI|nr:hypothetical protein QBC32DRAFT_126081 [Pseudoneurospora amorphoporcata]